MASFLQKALKLINPFDQYSTADVVRQSMAAPGGYLSPERAGPLDPYGAFNNYKNPADLIQNGFGIQPQYNAAVQSPAMQGPAQAPTSAGGGGGSAAPVVDNALLEQITAQLLQSLGLLEGKRTGARQSTDRSKSRLMQQVAQMLEELTQGETKGRQDIGSYYSGLGDIYQSSEGVRQEDLGRQVASERGRVEREKTSNIEDIDRSLAEYLQGTNLEERGLYDQATQMRDQAYGGATDLRGQFNVNQAALNTADPSIGAVQMTDTSALLKQLNDFLTPSNLRNRNRTAGSNSTNPIYSYLNAV